MGPAGEHQLCRSRKAWLARVGDWTGVLADELLQPDFNPLPSAERILPSTQGPVDQI